MMPEGCREETMLGMQVLGLNFLLQLMLENPAAAVATLAQVLHRRLLLLVAVSTWWPLRMTNSAISDKFHSTLLLDVTAACLASVVCTWYCKCFDSSLVISSCIFISEKKHSRPLGG